ncbi:MAG: hypothetical protein ABL857_00155 [Rickettsiales bacterium]
MTSKREQVISALFNKLKTLETASLKIYRNLDKPQTIPTGGIMVLRDGAGDEPEILLSPLTYIYEHLLGLEVLVQNADSSTRSNLLDGLLVNIGSIINANRTLDGLAEWVEAKAPDFNDDPIEGAATIRSANVQIMVRFFTTDPLN